MSYQIYESHNGDMRLFTYDDDIFHHGGKQYYSNVQYYVTDSNYREYWLAVCNNGHIIKIEPKKVSHLLKEKKINKVGYLAKFHYQLSNLVSQHLLTGKQQPKEILNVINNRRRCLWFKEYRGA